MKNDTDTGGLRPVSDATSVYTKRRFECISMNLGIMEFEFRKNMLLGEYYAAFNMEHAVISRFLEDETGADRTIIDQVLQLLQSAYQDDLTEQVWFGREISLKILEGEVTIFENILTHTNHHDFEDEFELYESESIATCGLDDFESMLMQWQQFTLN
ncbi:hypothetical protein Vspart_00592 [Vibrio spartinae]|uniref:Uncharacterized protein n=2 Tax=Vibrio spartinae TaxID=1918945 RepID=A0A1N6M4A0_9VIBR|nr:hypothetical protein Vspart_00592 [Vibrio spartinae]SIO94248.1 hypothetical protein VSP9026_01935 [Vibrio spartinae]